MFTFDSASTLPINCTNSLLSASYRILIFRGTHVPFEHLRWHARVAIAILLLLALRHIRQRFGIKGILWRGIAGRGETSINRRGRPYVRVSISPIFDLEATYLTAAKHGSNSPCRLSVWSNYDWRTIAVKETGKQKPNIKERRSHVMKQIIRKQRISRGNASVEGNERARKVI